MTDDIALLTHRIHVLLEEPLEGERSLLLERLEDTLTAGYARALALEAERMRLERRVGELAAVLDEASTGELTALARRLSSTDVDLSELRQLLGALRDRAREFRAA